MLIESHRKKSVTQNGQCAFKHTKTISHLVKTPKFLFSKLGKTSKLSMTTYKSFTLSTLSIAKPKKMTF